jgi:hypothetical protein
MQEYRLTASAIFPRALPAAARVDVRPEVVAGDAKFSVVCFVLAGAWAGFLATPFLPAFELLKTTQWLTQWRGHSMQTLAPPQRV